MDTPHLTITPFISQIRIYDEPDGYEKRIPYKGIITVTYLNEKTAYLSGAVGEINRKVYNEIVKLLKAEGIEEVLFERRGSFKTRTDKRS
jgi:hypothetical protein